MDRRKRQVFRNLRHWQGRGESGRGLLFPYRGRSGTSPARSRSRALARLARRRCWRVNSARIRSERRLSLSLLARRSLIRCSFLVVVQETENLCLRVLRPRLRFARIMEEAREFEKGFPRNSFFQTLVEVLFQSLGLRGEKIPEMSQKDLPRFHRLQGMFQERQIGMRPPRSRDPIPRFPERAPAATRSGKDPFRKCAARVSCRAAKSSLRTRSPADLWIRPLFLRIIPPVSSSIFIPRVEAKRKARSIRKGSRRRDSSEFARRIPLRRSASPAEGIDHRGFFRLQNVRQPDRQRVYRKIPLPQIRKNILALQDAKIRLGFAFPFLDRPPARCRRRHPEEKPFPPSAGPVPWPSRRHLPESTKSKSLPRGLPSRKSRTAPPTR